MADVSIRDLRNHGGDIVDRASNGEHVRITRNGRPVAELRPVGPSPIPIAALIRRRAALPCVDPERLRNDIDDLLDTTL